MRIQFTQPFFAEKKSEHFVDPKMVVLQFARGV